MDEIKQTAAKLIANRKLPPPSRARSCAAVIVAAGSGTRMGFDKVFAPLAGIPLFLHSVRVFRRSEFIGPVVVVGGVGKCERIASALADEAIEGVRVVPGGAERMDSVIEGLRALDPWPGLVAVHDAARPLLSAAALERCHEAARRTGAAACAEPLADTIHRAGTDRIASESLDRGGVWRMQTPQIFPHADILRALLAARKEGRQVTDEAGAAIAAGMRVELVEPGGWNFKVTRPADYDLARLILAGHPDRTH